MPAEHVCHEAVGCEACELGGKWEYDEGVDGGLLEELLLLVECGEQLGVVTGLKGLTWVTVEGDDEGLEMTFCCYGMELL